MRIPRFLPLLLAAAAIPLGLTGCGPSGPKDASTDAARQPAKPAQAPATPAAAPRQLVANAWKSSWAPDSQRIAIGRGPGKGIDVFDLRTQKRTTVSPEGKDPAWSPDGLLIAHVREPEYNTYQSEEIWVIAPDGTGLRRIGPGGFPAWSADGKRLIVHDRTANRLITYDPAATNTPPAVFAERALSWYPAVSPDGSKVAYGVPGQLVVTDRSTGQIVASWPTPDDGGLLPAWSPDGKLVAFGGFDASQLGLCVFEVASKRAARVAAGNFTMPAWSPDGRYVAYDNRAGDREIWIAERAYVDSRLADPAAALSRERTPPAAPRAQPREEDTTSLQDQPAPDFDLALLDDQRLRLADLKGSVVVADFWATWCPPCRKSLPHLQKISEDAKLKERGLKVFAINLREEKAVAREFLEKNKYTFAVPFDSDGATAAKYRVQGIPTTVIIDRQGVIRSVSVGFGPGGEEALDQAIEKVLGKP